MIDKSMQNLVNTKDAAKYLGLNEQTLVIWRMRGVGPAWHTFGRAVRYALSDLEAYAQSSRHAPMAGDAQS